MQLVMTARNLDFHRDQIASMSDLAGMLLGRSRTNSSLALSQSADPKDHTLHRVPWKGSELVQSGDNAQVVRATYLSQE